MIATYRLQLHPEFGFEHVRALLPYFVKLGISHLYLSPITQARRGSTHGYDVTDHNAVSEELGGREAFMKLADECAEANLKIILDFVPNHAGVGPRNRYWQDVLAFGPYAQQSRFFDIEWTPLKPELQNKILLPFLGRTYGEVLDDGELSVSYEDGFFYAQYYDNRFALTPCSYADILDVLLESFEREEVYFDLKHLASAYVTLKGHEIQKAESLRVRLARILEKVPVENALQKVHGDVLHEILERQYWRLSFWKTASSEINYRRFFDINELVALRMEDEHVFWDGHRMLGELLAHSAIEGVRIDHVDGLADPHSYLVRLREVGPDRVWVEKILAPGETLPEEWPVDGTTGYEFMNDVSGLLLSEEGQVGLDRTYRRFVGHDESFSDVVYRSKTLVMRTTLASELLRLAYELDRISEADYHTRDFTLEALQRGLREIVAALDRYRTYLPHDGEEAADVIREAVYRAMARKPAIDPSVLEFIRSVILGDVREDLQPLQQAWTRRLQQYCAPVAAKGVEDTAFYRYHRLAALNEVGGEPAEFGQTPQAFHSRCRFRAMRYPQTLLGTATHDHKRGEDTRMRLIALSEIPHVWDDAVQALEFITRDYIAEPQPSPADVYLYAQMLVSLWEDSDHAELPDRLWSYMQKASRESKEHTSWISPDAGYEEALETLVRGVATDERTASAISTAASTIADLGFHNSITQLILKFTTPGVPDIYQGSELWDLSLVDPDNRRPVDFERRRELIESFEERRMTRGEILDRVRKREVSVKLYVMLCLMGIRREMRLSTTSYREVTVEGEHADRWFAFLREDAEEALLVAVRRHFGSNGGAAASMSLPDEWSAEPWTDVLTGESIPPDEAARLRAEAPWVVLRSG